MSGGQAVAPKADEIAAANGECVALLVPNTEAGRGVVALIEGRSTARLLRVGRADPLFSRLDVGGNVGFALSRSRTAGERARATDDLLASAGLEHLAGRRVRQLGPAERIRVLLARAFAATQPLLIDDLFAGLSSEERGSLQIVLRRLVRQRRAAVVLVTMERSELLACGDRIGIVERGLPAVRPAASLLASPPSAFAARALLEAELFPGRVGADLEDDEADVHLACGATVPARLFDGVGAGDLCLVAVRPDQIAFAALPAREMGDRSVEATLIEVCELGDHLRLRLRLADGTQVWVRRPSASLTQRDVARASEPGGASLAWRSASAVAYPHPDA
jgi:putative spermidine/putrescine transport system ATP-binding protein